MKKIINVILVVTGFVSLLSACKSETYADKLKQESKAINRFIDVNGINVLGVYPKDHKFAKNEYFKDNGTGIYFRVIDPGTEEKPSKTERTEVFLRYFNVLNILNQNDTVAWSNRYRVYMNFRYGVSSTYSLANPKQNEYETQMYQLLSQACVIPLDYGLGNNAEVSLIVPFANGSPYQQNNYFPFYYERLVYRFTNDWDTEEKE